MAGVLVFLSSAVTSGYQEETVQKLSERSINSLGVG